MKCILLVGAALISVAYAQSKQYTTPVPILKQINKHNEDGSYSYGYEAADGTFKIETKYPDGEVYGKYGYVDDVGKVREVEYGASRRGFEPQGHDINVAPPTLRASNDYAVPLRPGEEDDGQYREDPAAYYKDDAYNRQPAPAPAPVYRQQPAYQQPAYEPQPAYQAPAPRPQPTYRAPAPRPQPAYQAPAPRPQPAFRPQSQSEIDFDDFRSTLGFSQPTQAPAYQAPAPRAPAYQPPASTYQRPAPTYNSYQPPANTYNSYQEPANRYTTGYNNYNNGYNQNTYSNNYNNGYNSYRAPISHEPLPYNVDLNTGSYSLNVGR